MAVKITDLETNEDVTSEEKDLHLFKGQPKQIPTKAQINFPLSLLLVLKWISDIKNDGNEFAVLYDVQRVDNGLIPTFEVIPQSPVFIPEQKVSVAAVEFTNPSEIVQYNGVVHRHPDTCRRFSSTDELYLNSLFSVSIVFIPPYQVPDAIVNLSVGNNAKIQVPAEVKIVDDLRDFDIYFSFNQKTGQFEPNNESLLSLCYLYLNTNNPIIELAKIKANIMRPTFGVGLKGNGYIDNFGIRCTENRVQKRYPNLYSEGIKTTDDLDDDFLIEEMKAWNDMFGEDDDFEDDLLEKPKKTTSKTKKKAISQKSKK